MNDVVHAHIRNTEINPKQWFKKVASSLMSVWSFQLDDQTITPEDIFSAN